MQDELLQFKLQKVWTLVDLPNGKRPIGTKWVFRNKKDERGIVIKNKARLVAQGYTQEEGIDYDKVFAPIARIEATRLFLAYASFKDYVVYQMDVKYDIIFGSTKKSLCTEFEKMMHKKFQMSSMGELTFFLRLQTASTPMETQKLLLKDEDGEEVDVHLYRSMIGSLMYLTSSRPDIMFAVCACARYQVNPKVSHLHVMERTFRYLKGQPKLGLWYPKDLPFDLVAYTNSDYAGASLDRKSTTGGCQFLRCRLISWQCKKQTVVANSTSEAEYVAASSMDCLPNATIFEELTRMGSKTTAWNEFSSTMASAIICLATNQKFNFSKFIFESMVKNLENVSGKFLMYPRFVQVFLDKQLEGMQSHKRIYDAPSHTKKIFGNMKRVGKGFSGRVTPLFPTMVVQAQEEMGEDEAVNEEMDDSLVRAATTAFSLEAEQDSSNILKTRSKATPNEPSSPGTSSGGGPRHQETIGDTIAQTRSENVSKLSNDPLLARGNTLRSGEDSLKLKELMELCTNLQNRVIDLEKIKTSQAQEITSLKRRVKRLEKKGGSRTHRLKRLYKVGLSRRVESSDEEGLGEEDASKQGRIADIDADAGINLVSTHFDADTYMFGVHDLVGDEVVVESEVAVKAASTIPVSAATTTTTVITNDEITLLKHCCTEQTKREEEKRNRPPTRAQQRSFMCTYLKNMEGWKPKDLKNKSFVNIQELFDKAIKRVNTFVDYRTELVDKDKETTELQRPIEIVLDKEEVAIDAIPFATKPPSIVDYKIHKEGKKTYYQIIRANGSSKLYLVFSHMLKSFDMEDLETLWILVKAKHGSTRPDEGYERVLWGDLKTMFDPHVEDQVWRNQQDYRVLD
ncbi:putative ribonuclease H-like domain-containing protein [Tanacetum coccineum]|uniref:Ribonuclease H-like domain-containing protein n=1 Tax=Tanacetum coccineum TaxID=301880 RepID=A0ABQ4X6U0_9ASTR